jgi:hypothetical protein
MKVHNGNANDGSRPRRQAFTEDKVMPKADNLMLAHPALEELHFALTSEQSRAATPLLPFWAAWPLETKVALLALPSAALPSRASTFDPNAD